ncbi:flippase [Vibrio cholerae]|uniref:flippase n=1 Tax=Vibrio cholerae TaxID=666 RepID=UPI001159EEBD|nr:flippase [Vibrio cholerae]TQQ42016.1 flippase [Vibrio cholerae]
MKIKLFNHSVVKSSSWMLLEKVSRLFLGVLVSSLMARSLGPSDFGQLNFLISLLSIASVLSSLGLNRIIVREVANNVTDKLFINETVFTTLYLRLIVSLLLWIAAMMLCVVVFNDDFLYVAIVFFSLFFISFDVFDFYAQGCSNFKIISLCRLLVFLVTSALKLYLIYMGYGLESFILLVLIEYILIAIAFHLFFIRRSILLHSSSIFIFNSRRATFLLKESWPEIIAGFGAILFMRVDQVFLQLISGDESVGIYSAATRITEAWYFLPAVLISTTFPKLLDARNNCSQRYQDGLQLLMSFLVLLSIVVAAFFTITADLIVALLFGKSYAESANVIMLHTWGGVFLCMGLASGSWLVAEKKLKLNLFRNLFGLAVSALANWILIPKYGVTGSAMATVAGLSAAFYFFDILHPQLRKMFWIKTSAFLPIYIFKYIRQRN